MPAEPTGKFLIPLPGARVMSPYGRRRFEFHTGIDLQLSLRGGEPVLASRAGRVVEVRRAGGYGRMVLLRHVDGFFTRYGHLRIADVRAGQSVEALQKIGRVGRSGRASGQHLHFEILTPDKRHLDPAPYLFGR